MWDWVETSFLPYGYDMVSLDGWIEGATQTTANGYVLSYNDSWLQDISGPNDPDTWKQWGDYVKSKGLKFGVYYNPLWVTPAAVNDSSKTVINHPDIKISDIVNSSTTTTDWFGHVWLGDRFETIILIHFIGLMSINLVRKIMLKGMLSILKMPGQAS